MAFRPLIVVSLCLVAVLRICGESTPPEKMNLSGLVSNSPFGSSRAGVANGNAGGEPFEFRAVLEEKGSKFFSIFETATRRSNWVELNDPVNGFSVKGYDVAKETITVDYQGKSMTLAIKRAPAVAQVMQQPIPQPMPGPNGMVQPVGSPSVQGGPTAPTAVDQQRIQQIQEEIRRRRALRSQAATPGVNPVGQPNYGGGPQPQPSNSAGPMPMPSPTGVQQIPQKTNP